MVNNGVPIALIGSRNFTRLMTNVERRCPVWGSEQFRGRIRLRKSLPESLGQSDLEAIARILLPTATPATVTLLIGHALMSNGRLGDMESAATRARWFAEQRGGDLVSFEDLERALGDASNTKSIEALQEARRKAAAATVTIDRRGVIARVSRAALSKGFHQPGMARLRSNDTG
jgi:hypothetical protein